MEYLGRDFDGLLFVNLVDYDMLYGHRRDIDGYAKAVAYFDEKLPDIVAKLGKEDLLMITADHGCDPGYLATTDHTREYVPFLCCSEGFDVPEHIRKGNLSTRKTFADIAASILTYLDVPKEKIDKVDGEDMLGPGTK